MREIMGAIESPIEQWGVLVKWVEEGRRGRARREVVKAGKNIFQRGGGGCEDSVMR